jgi:hypothetical protein
MPPTLTTGRMRAQYLWPGPRIAQHNRRFLGSHILRSAIRYVVGMIVERTFRETRTEKNFRKGATFFRTGAFVALTIGFLFRTGTLRTVLGARTYMLGCLRSRAKLSMATRWRLAEADVGALSKAVGSVLRCQA